MSQHDALGEFMDITKGISIGRLQEICDAERENRCVVLLPIDEEVLIIQDGKILWFRIYEYSLISINNKNIRYWAECTTDINEDCLDFWQDDIGISVFLTRESAEKALKEREHI